MRASSEVIQSISTWDPAVVPNITRFEPIGTEWFPDVVVMPVMVASQKKMQRPPDQQHRLGDGLCATKDGQDALKVLQQERTERT